LQYSTLLIIATLELVSRNTVFDYILDNYQFKKSGSFKGVDEYFANLFEDTFLITLIDWYYSQKVKGDFYQYLKQQLGDYASFPATLRHMYEKHIDFVNAALERIGLEDSKELLDVVIAGDVHPQITKIHSVYSDGDQKIGYLSPFSHLDIMRDIAMNFIPEITDSFPITFVNKNYHWREYKAAKLDGSAKEVKEFYYDLGQIAALTLFLRGHDMNAENMLCDMPRPYFYDTECLFAPNIRDDEYSLLATGISDPNPKENASVLFAGDKNRTSYLKPVLSGTLQKPQIKWRVPSNKQLYNRPILNGQKTFAKDYKAEILDGFESASKKLSVSIPNIIDLVRASSTFNRVLLRPTRLYVAAIRKLTFPNIYNEAGFSADSFFQKEISATPVIVRANLSSEFINQESEYLQQAIVPAYYCHIHNKEVVSAEKKVVGELPETPFNTWLSQTKKLNVFLSQQKNQLIRDLVNY
jgi:hypothetical protein